MGASKHVQAVAFADVVKAVLRLAAGFVAFVGAPGAGAPLGDVPYLSHFVFSHEHDIVILGVLVDQSGVGKVVQYLPVDPAVL